MASFNFFFTRFKILGLNYYLFLIYAYVCLWIHTHESRCLCRSQTLAHMELHVSLLTWHEIWVLWKSSACF